MDRIPSSTAAEDKSALGKIADDKHATFAWAIRDAITEYLSKKSEA